MQLLQDGVIAALAAVGLATIVWFTVTALTHPRERVHSETAVIVPARGAAGRRAGGGEAGGGGGGGGGESLPRVLAGALRMPEIGGVPCVVT